MWTEGVRTGFDEAVAGKRVVCDGGFVDAGGRVSRAEFAGTLTGEYVEEGTPPSRWYLVADLISRPAEYVWDGVWCESSFIHFVA